MPTWKVARPTKVCALSGRPLPPDAAVVAALFGVPEEVSEDKVLGAGLVRKDFLVEGNDPAALEAALKEAYCHWHTKTPPEHPGKAHRLDLGLARELLERLRAEGDPARAPVIWTLALLLVRKRQLQLVKEHAPVAPPAVVEAGTPAAEAAATAPAEGAVAAGAAVGTGELEVRWPKDEATFRIPAVVVTEAEQETLQQELARLFEF